MNAGRHTWTGIIAAIALAGCVLPDDPAPAEAGEAVAGPDEAAGPPLGSVPKFGEDDETDGMQTQGRFLIGRAFDALGSPDRHFAVSGEAVRAPRGGGAYTAEMVGPHLVVRGPDGAWSGLDRELQGVVFSGVDGGELVLGRSLRSPRGVVRYAIQVRTSRNAPWTAVCGNRTAVPMRGSFGRDGFRNDDDAITFACADGVASKCPEWGYRPANHPSDPLWDYFQACTRMARNDLCADGTAHTFEGTPIAFRDESTLTDIPEPPDTFTEPASWPPPPDAYFYEAAWRAGRRTPRCLARTRWSVLPPGDLCGGLLKDPRLDVEAKTCEDLLDDPAGIDDALIFSASHYNDLAMHRWEVEGDLISTINGYYAAPGSDVPAEVPFGKTIATYHGRDGLLLRSLPESIATHEVVDLNLYERDGDRVVTTAATAPDGYALLEWQGFVFRRARGRTSPLYLHRFGQRHVTSTLPSLLGHEQVEIVGHVFTVPDDRAP
jgi:hypothetical protein